VLDAPSEGKVVVLDLSTAIQALMHEQGQAVCVCLANNVSKPVWANKEGAEE